MIAEPQTLRLESATFRSGRFGPMSASGVGVRSNTRFDPCPRMWREVAAHFQARRRVTRMAEGMCRQSGPPRSRSGGDRGSWRRAWERSATRHAWDGRPNVPLTDTEFAAILEDESKRIRDDIAWRDDEDLSPALEFRVDVESTNGWPLLLKGRYNPVAGTLTYALILKTTGRVLRS